MIKSFVHKGLEVFFTSGSTRGIQAKHAGRLARLLDRLDAATQVRDMDAPGYGLHPLKGELSGHWSVKVSGNWRVTFRFENGDAHVVNYQDYH
ncbi:type II toxin-antitoxin system RelE/ParE family toxin [Desulfocurvus vexinensis]|uniref:type II toxin-antitoxin system RelE/ParE family toxin n=1 Tax=Desulfocurvus vexinensis TaxID=399548 RepID=UPI0004915BB8|nr:type II toxin-antitoxin system RelE/ParE family toxin [Desulfocurvus vexinensis]